MKNTAKKIFVKIYKTSRSIIQSPFIIKDYLKYKKALKKVSGRFSVKIKDFYPQIRDKTIGTAFDRHYVYHTAWAARVVKEINPKKHIDISSSLFFSAIVSAFIPVDFYDYRPASLGLSNLNSLHGDLMNLPFKDKSIESLSCLHTIEHIGLGRYGDPIDPDGDIKAINELKRSVMVGGNLLLVMPLGRPKIEFNAHRIYSYAQIMDMVLDDDFVLHEFTYIPQYESEGHIVRNAKPDAGINAEYACGCYWFKRKK